VNVDRPFKLFNGRVTLPPKPFEKLRDIRLTRGNTYGHPLQQHPVYIPATEKKPEYNCLSCHTSHASATGLRRWNYDTRDELCRECHKF
jgi:predicted CXXCH cytochrome family protein